MILLAGLGNPGNEYKNTRHNAGFMFIDALARKYNFILEKTKYYHLCKDSIDNISVILIKPQTYMNKSGVEIAKIANFYKIMPLSIFVFHDDVEVDLGKVKYKTGGGEGGHNGLRSISENIGKNYNRVRIGVGRPTENQIVADYVLSDFKSDELIEIHNVINLMVNNIQIIINK